MPEGRGHHTVWVLDNPQLAPRIRDTASGIRAPAWQGGASRASGRFHTDPRNEAILVVMCPLGHPLKDLDLPVGEQEESVGHARSAPLSVIFSHCRRPTGVARPLQLTATNGVLPRARSAPPGAQGQQRQPRGSSSPSCVDGRSSRLRVETLRSPNHTMLATMSFHVDADSAVIACSGGHLASCRLSRTRTQRGPGFRRGLSAGPLLRSRVRGCR